MLFLRLVIETLLAASIVTVFVIFLALLGGS